jgi:DNA-directed RNA polymerase specialized sigma subunit
MNRILKKQEMSSKIFELKNYGKTDKEIAWILGISRIQVIRIKNKKKY